MRIFIRIMYKPLYIAFFIFSLFRTDQIIGQTPFYVNFNINEGLPSSEIYQIHCTEEGKVWSTTDRGVAVYNGYEFKTYSTADGLTNNTNFKIFEDSQSRIWFTGLDGDISIFENGKFRNLNISDQIKSFVPGALFNAPLEDSQGRLLLFYLNPSSQEHFFRISADAEKFEVLQFEDLWAAYPQLNSPDIKAFVFGDKAIAHFDKKNIYFPMIRYGEDWLGKSNHKVFKFDKYGSLIQQFNNQDKIESNFIDKEMNLWVTTHKGLLYFDNADLQKTPRRFFPNFLVTNIKQDIEDNYWISTHESGLYLIPYFKMEMVKLPEEMPRETRILTVSALEGHIFFGTTRNMVLAVDKENKVSVACADYVNSTKQLRNANRFSNRIHFSGFVVEENDGDYSCKQNSRGNNVFELSTGDLFFSSAVGFVITTNKGLTIASKDFSVPFLLRVECVVEDREGNIWIGSQKGLYQLNSKDYLSCEKVLANEPKLKGRITDIVEDSDGNLWLATLGEGVIYKSGDQIYHIPIDKSLSSNFVNCALVQDEHTVWFGTNRGLNRLDYNWKDGNLDILQVKSYGKNEGLPSNFINDIEFWKGDLWLATNKGIGYIAPEDLDRRHINIPIRLEQLVVNGESKSIEQHLHLNHKENNLLLKLEAISFLKGNSFGFYRYKLAAQGTDMDWSYTDQRDIQFVDLAPGKYTFEAAARNKSGHWSKQPLNFTFEIKPHFSQTLWFQGLLLIGLGLLLWLFFRYREQQIQKSNALQQGLLKANMQANEHELSALRNQMNPHFVFNSLNAIQHFIFKNKKEKANYYLSIFSKLMRDSLRFSRLKYISLKEEVDFLKSYLELEQLRFPGKFQFSFALEPELPMRHYAIPALLLQPVLENVIKHAFKDIKYLGRLVIEIKESTDGRQLLVRIDDNGIGFDGNFFDTPKGKEHQSLGLAIVKNRIDLINAENKDQLVSIQIKNKFDLDETLSGVRVEFKIPIQSVKAEIE